MGRWFDSRAPQVLRNWLRGATIRLVERFSTGGGGSRPVLKLGVAQQAGDEFVAKQTFISLFRNGMNAFFISL